MKLLMLRGVFYRNEKDENDEGRVFAKQTIVDVPDYDPAKALPGKEPPALWIFAKGLIAQGRAREATEADVAAVKAAEKAAAKAAKEEAEKDKDEKK